MNDYFHVFLTFDDLYLEYEKIVLPFQFVYLLFIRLSSVSIFIEQIVLETTRTIVVKFCMYHKSIM